MNFPERLQNVSLTREMGLYASALEQLDALEQEVMASGSTENLVPIGMERAANLRHQYKESQDPEVLQAAWTALQTVESFTTEETQVAFTFWQAQILFDQKHFTEAVDKYAEALAALDTINGQRGDFQTHLGVSTFLAGNQEAGLELVYQGIQTLLDEQKETDSYNHAVWLSGAYLRLAKLLKLQGKTGEAQTFLEKAREITDSNEKLIIRRTHVEEAARFLTEEHPSATDAF